MRKLIESTLVSLDGVVGAPWEWTGGYFDGEVKDYSLAQLDEYDAFLLGRVTYEKFASSWGAIQGDPYLDKINSMSKYVASTTLRETTWNATLLDGDLAEEVAKLKAQPGKALIKYGTSGLDRTLIEHNLIDRFQFLIFPVVVGGSGGRLFEGVEAGRLKLELVETKTFGNGVVALNYVPG
ncbi:dihydrofolate reductase family protein [Pseudonocardia acaciae]|uniref:dihydrofolate reductase family protein n=1 Tax=Pseudonocardia acaciae TaxID=551276 RepID=UPI00048E48A1|nr:dihydrofolate reductase family protein [Pseudonocardia acaciae]